MLHDRIKGWLDTISQDSVIVSHGGVARVLMVLRTGMPSHEAADAEIWQGKLLLFKSNTTAWI
jgi:broad specificity phosphatase PhoE